MKDVFDSFNDDIKYHDYVYYFDNFVLSFQDTYIEVCACDKICDIHVDFIIHIKSQRYISIYEYYAGWEYDGEELTLYEQCISLIPVFVSKSYFYILQRGL